MRSILEQLYDGEIYPAEQFNVKAEEYQRVMKEHSDHYEEFVEKLNNITPSLGERFMEIMDEQLDAIPIEMAEIFIAGFRLGARLMVEVFED